MALQHGWRTAPFIYGTQAFENLAEITVQLTLFTFLYNYMHFQPTEAANISTNFLGTAALLSLVGGFISDTYTSRFSTLMLSGALEIVGYTLLVISAAIPSLHPPACIPYFTPCQTPDKIQKAVMYVALYVLALGMGGVKPNLPSLGADQFNEHDTIEKRSISAYFNWFYFSICVGAVPAVTVFAYLQQDISRAWSFGICTISMGLALIVLICGYPLYKKKKHLGSPLTRFAQVFVVSFRNRNLKLESCGKKIQFRFLDKALMAHPDKVKGSTNPWKQCTIQQVEEVKCMLRVLPIFATTIMLSCVLAQLQTFSIQQAQTLHRKLTHHFTFPVASVGFFPLFAVLLLLPIYDRLFVPFARKITGHERGITNLQRIGLGLLLSCFTMVIAALVETKRIRVATSHHLLNNPMVILPMSVFWIGLQYSCFGLADLFTFAGLLDFYYGESPESLHSMSTSLMFVSNSLGYFLSSAIVSAVNSITKHGSNPGWLPRFNINQSKLSNFYWLLAVLGFINFMVYVVLAKWYKGGDYTVDNTEDSASKHHEKTKTIELASV